MRTKRTFINTIVGIVTSLITTFLSFYLNKIFLSILGLEYLGLNGIFSNALGMLSLTEMGIGLAISYELYTPLAENNTDKISALMNLYKRVYHIIALVTLIIGIFVGLFISFNINSIDIPIIDRFVYFFMFLFNNCCTYLLSYKRTLLEADQRSYITATVSSFISICATLLKIAVLYYKSSYFLYIFITVLQTLVLNILISFYIDKTYPYLNKNSATLDAITYKNIVKEVKSRIIIQFCNVIVSSTDNILIGSIVSVSSAGLFQNYNLIISQLNVFISQISNSITASLGNYNALESKTNLITVIKEIEFLNHCVGTFCFSCFCVLVTPFIRLWLGNYLLPQVVPLLLMLNFYIVQIRDVHWKVNNMTYGFKHNYRVYYHILRASLNILISLVGGYLFGVSGVVLGTLVSSVAIWLLEAHFLYKKVLNIEFRVYMKRQLEYAFQLFLIYAIIYVLTNRLSFSNLLITFLLDGVISVLLTIILLFIMNYKNPNLLRLLNRVKILLRR